MKLTKFNTISTPKTWFKSNKSAKITFGKSGTISLNKPACQIIGLIPGDKIELAQDDENLSNWYISKSKEGFELRGKDFDKIGQLTFNHKSLNTSFLDCFEFPLDVTRAFEISEAPIKFENKLYYLIQVTAE